jgi:hypothetical protein
MKKRTKKNPENITLPPDELRILSDKQLNLLEEKRKKLAELKNYNLILGEHYKELQKKLSKIFDGLIMPHERDLELMLNKINAEKTTAAELTRLQNKSVKTDIYYEYKLLKFKNKKYLQQKCLEYKRDKRAEKKKFAEWLKKFNKPP